MGYKERDGFLCFSMVRTCLLILSFTIVTFYPAFSFPGTDENGEKVRSILDKECINLKKERLFDLLMGGFSSDPVLKQAQDISGGKGLDPDLLKIMEGVIKRTDFDGISEDKTFEIIKLVYGAFRKGAPLDYLDEIFDVAYTKDITIEQLFAAAHALREFYNSDVPQDIYEEFVYHAIEEKWNPAVMPALTRGLIYGVDRGLTPQKVALAIIIDVDQGGLKKKGADKLILDAIKFVREKEPEKWRPMKDVERELMMKIGKKRELEKLRGETEAKKREKEIEKQKAEEGLSKRLDEEKLKFEQDRQKLIMLQQEAERKRQEEAALRYKREQEEIQRRFEDEDKRLKVEKEKVAQDIEKMMKAYQDDILRYQREQTDVEKSVEKQMKEMEKEKEKRNWEREEMRKKELEMMEQRVTEYGKRGNLNTNKLFSTIEKHLGIPYRFGGDSEYGIDCSAFTRRVYREQGTEIPRTSQQQAMVGKAIRGTALQPGDLVFFNTSIIGTVSHVGVYMDNNTFAHASKSQGVTKSSLRERYYSRRYVRANRIFIE
ncbi:MAG: C40 family peptidase [Nitrospinae bacterium]|nr:C40 family peptidase [Nitrospinota bacterium]